MITRTLDPEVAAGIRAAMQATAGSPPPTDLPGIRRALDAAMLAYPRPPGGPVGRTDVLIADGLPGRLYRPAEEPASLVCYLHGGGGLAGSLDTHDAICAGLAADGAALLLAVDYRLAPEHPHPAQVEDALTALRWLDARRAELGAVGLPLVVAGDSAGAGFAAAAALATRDGGPAVDLQLLLYPMLDDRTRAADRRLVPLMTWTPPLNTIAWQALLGPGAGGPAVADGATPARTADLTGAPPAFLEVGDLDLFLAETLAYASRLADRGVPFELHVHRGMPHAGEAMAPATTLAARVRADRAAALRGLGAPRA